MPDYIDNSKLQLIMRAVRQVLAELKMPADEATVRKLAEQVLADQSFNVAKSAAQEVLDHYADKAGIDLTSGKSLQQKSASQEGSDGRKHAAYLVQKNQGSLSAEQLAAKTTHSL